MSHNPINELVLASRILANEGVLDGFGHVSVRDPSEPDCFLLSRARAPELVERPDAGQRSNPRPQNTRETRLTKKGREFAPTGRYRIRPACSGAPQPTMQRFRTTKTLK
jgi:hypothetical protein